MNFAAKLKHRIYLFLDRPGAGRPAKILRRQIDLWTLCLRQLQSNNVLSMSSGLSFRTMFAMIPTLVLALVVLRAAHVFGDPHEQVRRLLDAAGLPHIVVAAPEATSEPKTASAPSSEPASAPAEHPSRQREIDLAGMIYHMVERIDQQMTVGKIGPVGILVLAWTAITLMMTLEESVNRVFYVRRKRAFWRRVLLYWSGLTLLPLLLAVGTYSLTLFEAPLRALPGVGWAIGAAGWIIWTGVTFVGLALLYKLLPNTQVGFSYAIRGAAVAVPLWLLTHWGLSIYIARFVGKGNLYGALGLLPLFLMWLNILWWVFLLGAATTYVTANQRSLQSMNLASSVMLGPLDLVGMMLMVQRAFELGKGPVKLWPLSKAIALPQHSVEIMLARLVRSKLLSKTHRGAAKLLTCRAALAQRCS